MNRAEQLNQEIEKVQALKKQLENILYYAEEEDLLIKEDKPNGWNTLEIIEHINLVNAAYLSQINADDAAVQNENTLPKRGFLASKMIKSFAPSTKEKGFKMKSPASVHPLKRIAKGFKPVSKVAFRQIVQDLDQIEVLLEASKTQALEKLKVRTLISWLKITAFDALPLMIAHTQRHLAQAQRLQNR